MSINEILNDAITEWVALTGTNPEQRKFTFRYNDMWSDYALIDFLKDLNASRDYDPSGLTTFMLLKAGLESYADAMKFSGLDYIKDQRAVEKKLRPIAALRDVLANKKIAQETQEFRDAILTAAKHYGIEDVQPLVEFMEDEFSLAYVRRDAFRSVETLEVHQFVRGNNSTETLQCNPHVFEFWNIQSLLRAMRTQKISGISMVLIRDMAIAYSSFFCFAIRDGETLTILTDREKSRHPLQKLMSRRPERTLEARIERHRFPYDLLDLSVTDDNRLHVAEDKTSIVPLQTEAIKLRHVNTFSPDVFIWTVMIFDLLREKKFHVAETSYTADMIVEPFGFIGKEGSIIKDGTYTPLVVQPITKNDLADVATAEQWSEKPQAMHQWLVDRYGAQVPDEILNPVGETALPQLTASVVDNTGIVLNDPSIWEHHRRKDIGLVAMDPLTFDSKEKIERDRIWVARINQCHVIHELAKKEFEERRREMAMWVQRKIVANQQFIFEAACRDKCDLPTHVFQSTHGFSRTILTEVRSAIRQCYSEKHNPYDQKNGFHAPHFNEFSEIPNVISNENGSVSFTGGCDKGHFKCYDTGAAASVFTLITPNCAEALAVLCGLSSVDELPDLLRNWRQLEPYHGNQILSRIDPIDWVIKNPWTTMEFKVFSALSKRAFDRRRKALGFVKKNFNE